MKFLYSKEAGGRHQEGDVTYKPGDVVESWRDLETIFPGRFTRCSDPQEDAEEEATLHPEYGANVTDQFEVAEAKGLLVFKTKSGYFRIFSEDAPDKQLNEKLIRLEAATSFVNEYKESGE